jgi:monofunctional biosynthetic peptidoglycan transglycosylase
MSRLAAARIAAVLPLPKKRGVVTPKGFTRRYGNTISARIGVVGRDGLDACVYEDVVPPKEKTPPATKGPKQLPGEEYESSKPLPSLNEAVEDLPIIAVEPEAPTTEAAPDPDQSVPDVNVASPPATTEEPPPEPVQ